MQKPDWTSVLERAGRDRLPVAKMNVRLYADGNFHHGNQFCGHNAHEVELGATEAVTTIVPDWCECGGWLGTRFGALLQAAADQYKAIDEESGSAVHPDWQSVWQAFVGLSASYGWTYRTDDSEIESFRRRTRQATLSTIERSRGALDVADLERRIAAQGLTIPIRPEEGAFLQRWARDMRIETREFPTIRPIRLDRREATAPFDTALERAIETARRERDLVLVFVLRGREDELPIDRGLPPELGLLFWATETDTSASQLRHIERPIAQGIAAISPGHPRIAVAGTDETDPDVLETIRALCEDAALSGDPGKNQRPVIDLDGIVATARLL